MPTTATDLVGEPIDAAVMPAPSGSVLTEARKAGDLLSQHVFEGDTGAFTRTLKDYINAHGHEDLGGRFMLKNTVGRVVSPIAYRAPFLDRDLLIKESRKRWTMWLEVLPLDLQISLIHFHMDRRRIEEIAWDQVDMPTFHQINESDHPEIAFRSSNIGAWWDGRQPSVGSPAQKHAGSHELQALNWIEVKQSLHDQFRYIAQSLVAWKDWETLDGWMGQVGIHPWERMDSLYAHYTTSFSRGSHYAQTLNGLPFWMSGLFCGAIEEGFWQVMAKHGGPASPAQGHLEPQARENLDRLLRAQGKQTGHDPASFNSPLELIESLDHRLGDESKVMMEHTAAAWRQASLNEKFSASTPSRTPLRF